MAKTTDQVRELVDSLRPRSPKEVMGEAANSSLLGSTITAALSTVVLLFGLTVIVFFIGGGPDKSIKASKAAPAAASQPRADGSGQPAEQAASAETAKPKETDTDTAIEAMGIGETKDVDAEPKTLENRLDQLLDGLE